MLRTVKQGDRSQHDRKAHALPFSNERRRCASPSLVRSVMSLPALCCRRPGTQGTTGMALEKPLDGLGHSRTFVLVLAWKGQPRRHCLLGSSCKHREKALRSSPWLCLSVGSRLGVRQRVLWLHKAMNETPRCWRNRRPGRWAGL